MYGRAVSREMHQISRDTALRTGVYLVAREHETAACLQTPICYITGNQILLTRLVFYTLQQG